MQEIRIFLFDLDPLSGLRNRLKEILESSTDPFIQLQHESARTAAGATAFNRELFHAIQNYNPALIFLVLPASNLDEINPSVQSLCAKLRETPVMVVIEDVTLEGMIGLLKSGVADFITPPLKTGDVLARVWRLVEQRQGDKQLNNSLKKKIGLKQLIGQAPAFLAEINKIELLSKCDARVLILGETGTGKEMFARAIHYLSPRADKSFVPVNCGAIPAELVENELFGHAEGAFTGASRSYPGLINEADGGTLLLDEIDCLPLAAQVKLLRFLQDKAYRQLGSARMREADVRIIAASNIDLGKAAADGKFRQDLFYRLNIIPFTLPPLRERKEDIPLLARYFLDKYAFEFKKSPQELSPEVLQKLLTHEWPGNVRELENVIERAVILSMHAAIQGTDIILPCSGNASFQDTFRSAKSRVVAQFEKSYIQELLLVYKGNISNAAKAAHKNRRAFWELIRKYKIDVQSLTSRAAEKPGQISASL
jgi:two-component system, NtrC family, response regulator GlrR